MVQDIHLIVTVRKRWWVDSFMASVEMSAPLLRWLPEEKLDRLSAVLGQFVAHYGFRYGVK